MRWVKKAYNQLKTGDFVKVRYQSKEYKGKLGDQVTMFRTGFVARELVSNKITRWIPWTPKADYWVRK